MLKNFSVCHEQEVFVWLPTELNPAQPGSALLAHLGLIKANLPWLGFFRFLGMSFLLTGITVALTVVIRTLQTQEKTLQKFLEAHSGWAWNPFAFPPPQGPLPAKGRGPFMSMWLA